MGQADSAPSSLCRQDLRSVTLLATATANPPQGREASPILCEVAPASELLEEIDASAARMADERSTKYVTFTDDKTGTLHRFLGSLLPTPKVGFGSTALGLARQLHELIGDHVDSHVRDRLTGLGFDSDHP